VSNSFTTVLQYSGDRRAASFGALPLLHDTALWWP